MMEGRPVPAAAGGVHGQLLRYVLTGGFVTALQAGVYWSLAHWLAVHPQLANFAGYLVAVACGFVLHSRFTFRGHGARDNSVARGARFVAVSLLSLGLNAGWVWLCTQALGWPLWSPIPLMGLVTPALVFVLNRQWVFR
ncbi:GtrA family protein [Sphingobium nicotianae]|uniref:GtrA family protein n=1 Tax=Sphingobium nicotianae TaxID=2782607 RepID=A0A9X1DFJ0_9SPHN|nr:GtrA family protein [Sphingobium nicotianae]MBT2188979.1 GtrA family protein [Sphingobium nicotianae]